MDGTLVVASFLGFGVIIALALTVGWLLRVQARRRTESRDDLARAGESHTTNPQDAARQAQGSTAWMRPGGGGGAF
jgi:hypothetical protein